VTVVVVAILEKHIGVDLNRRKSRRSGPPRLDDCNARMRGATLPDWIWRALIDTSDLEADQRVNW
jgi:hypothetical protein